MWIVTLISRELQSAVVDVIELETIAVNTLDNRRRYVVLKVIAATAIEPIGRTGTSQLTAISRIRIMQPLTVTTNNPNHKVITEAITCFRTTLGHHTCT